MIVTIVDSTGIKEVWAVKSANVVVIDVDDIEGKSLDQLEDVIPVLRKLQNKEYKEVMKTDGWEFPEFRIVFKGDE